MRASFKALGWVCVLSAAALTASAQPAAPEATKPEPANPEQANADQPAEELIQFNLPENVTLKVLADFVGQKLGMNIVYDQQLNGRTVTIKAPKALPASSLKQLLESMLKINGMVLVETDVPGVLRITQAAQLNEVAVGPLKEGDPVPKGGASQVVSRIFELEHVTPERVKEVVGPFITTSGGATLTELPNYDMVIITDYASNMDRIERLLALADRPGRAVASKFVAIENLGAEDLSAQLKTMLEAQGKVRGQAGRYELVANPRTNQLYVVTEPEDLDSVVSMIASLDVSLGLITEVYRLRVVTPEHVDEVARELIGEDKATRLYKSVADEESGLLAITTRPEIHEQISKLIKTMDEPVPQTSSPIRFYKLEHASALAVAETLNGIAGEGGLDTVSVDGVDASSPAGPSPAPRGDGAAGDKRKGSGKLPQARVLADVDTNTIIVVAPPGSSRSTRT